jgi:bifunctional non-homologous end joining protein LigD
VSLVLPSGPEGVVAVDGRTLRLTSLDRVLWPAPHEFTKRDLVAYYAAVAGASVTHLSGRPLSMVRLPHGVNGRVFLQNECRGAPEWMTTASLRLRDGTVRRYCVVDDLPSLVWVANLGTVELHPYPAPASRPDSPVALLLDLDPGPGLSLRDACAVALALRPLCAERELRPLPKTSGGDGLHLYAPLAAGTTFADARSVGREIAAAAHERLPELVAPPDARSRQPGRVLVDWLQNDPRRSTIAPYSLRAGERVRVSTPLLWDEVEAAAEDATAAAALRFGPADVLERLERFGDLFSPVSAPRG